VNLVVASPTGLCFGVRRAIEQLETALAEYRAVYSLGSPMHNPQEVARLAGIGLKLVEKASDTPEGEVSFVRAHGVARSELEELKSRSRLVIDGTCPHVSAAQKRAESLSKEGYKVVIVGDADHPEVRGILGHIEGESLVISSESEIDGKTRHGRLGILSQTTQKESSFVSVVSKLMLIAGEIKVYNTICGATIERQKSVQRLAQQVDGIIVIGGRNSANTRKLVEIAESLGVSAMWIEHSEELNRRWLEGKRSIGVAAGSSTPDWLIKDLKRNLQTL
jgi:4-hydroxy-3-methylbut-2-enyl diphosphate reductase